MRERMGWIVAGFLFAGSVLNYIDRAALAVVIPQVRRELGLSNTGYGVAVNAFLALYMVFYIWGGRLADRLGYRQMFTWTVLFWSAAQIVHGAAVDLASLCLARALLGIGEGGYYPSAIRGLSEWFGAERRAKAVGLLLGGLSIGTLVTPPLVAWLSLKLGWRAAFVVTGVAGVALAAPWWWLHREHPPEARRVEDEKAPLGEVLRQRQYWCVLGARAMTDGAWYFYLFWLPGYFQEVRRFDLAMVGQWLWIPYASAYARALAGGWASSALLEKGWEVNRARKGVLGPSAVLAGLGGLAYLAPGPFAALAVVSVALFGHLSWATNIHTVITEIAPARHLAVLYGITGAAGTLLGVLTQPVIGLVVDRSGHGPVFAGAGAAYAVALVLLALGGRIGGRPDRVA